VRRLFARRPGGQSYIWERVLFFWKEEEKRRRKRKEISEF
jgi:hypothetical protein